MFVYSQPMNSVENPFHPGFGVAPTVFVGRHDIVSRVDRAEPR